LGVEIGISVPLPLEPRVKTLIAPRRHVCLGPMLVVGDLYTRREVLEEWLARRGRPVVALMPFRLVEYVGRGGGRRALIDEAVFALKDPENLAFTVRNDLLKKGLREASHWEGVVVEGSDRSAGEMLGLYIDMVSRLREELEELYPLKLKHTRMTARSILSQMFFGGRRDTGLEEAAARATLLEFVLKLMRDELGIWDRVEALPGDRRVYVPVALLEGPVFYELVDKPRRSKIFNILYRRDEGYRRWITEKIGVYR